LTKYAMITNKTHSLIVTNNLVNATESIGKYF